MSKLSLQCFGSLARLGSQGFGRLVRLGAQGFSRLAQCLFRLVSFSSQRFLRLIQFRLHADQLLLVCPQRFERVGQSMVSRRIEINLFPRKPATKGFQACFDPEFEACCHSTSITKQGR